MFRRDTAQDAREAREMAVENRTELRSHVNVCLQNQTRIEGRFTGVENKLDRSDRSFEEFRTQQEGRLGAILEIGRKRYLLTMGAVVPTFLMMAFDLAMKWWGK